MHVPFHCMVLCSFEPENAFEVTIEMIGQRSLFGAYSEFKHLLSKEHLVAIGSQEIFIRYRNKPLEGLFMGHCG